MENLGTTTISLKHYNALRDSAIALDKIRQNDAVLIRNRYDYRLELYNADEALTLLAHENTELSKKLIDLRNRLDSYQMPKPSPVYQQKTKGFWRTLFNV